MEQSDRNQAVWEEGEARGFAKGLAEAKASEFRRIILKLGTKRFGPPGPEVESTLRQLDDLSDLESILDNLMEAATWHGLLSYQEGMLQEARKLVLRFATKRFGVPSPSFQSMLQQISDLYLLEGIWHNLSEVSSWQELLAGPTTKKE
jgi:hypothetical protein